MTRPTLSSKPHRRQVHFRDGAREECYNSHVPIGRRSWLVAAVVLVAGVASAGDGLSVLVREGRWDEVLRLARLQDRQVPLAGGTALVAAEAAGHSGDGEARRRFLEAALADPVVGAVARVELAGELVGEEPERAVELVLPVLAGRATWSLRERAVEVAAEALEAGIARDLMQRLRRTERRLPLKLRRRLQLARYRAEGPDGRAGLRRLLERRSRDLAALEAARSLLALGPEGARDRWLAARALYRHAHYGEAARLLEGLARRDHRGVPRWEVMYLRGRCAFRQDRWDEAVSWYLRALARAPSSARRAELLVHAARAMELGGDRERALRFASRALRTRPSDDRRLFVARLELSLGRVEAADRTLRAIRSGRARDRGWILEALFAHASGGDDRAVELLARVRSRRWKGPARVTAAGCAARAGRVEDAAAHLEAAAASGVSGFWFVEARRLAATMPEAILRDWRRRCREDLGAEGRELRRALLRWAPLTVDREGVLELREARERLVPLTGSDGSLRWGGRLARGLWELGLEEAAARWDPSGFPRASAVESAWTARQLARTGRTRLALRAAGSVRDRVAPDAPPLVFPESLQTLLYPLVFRGPLLAAAGEGGVPWTLLAAVSREESRWNPRALSAVGARGLVQLMPATAARVAASRGWDPPRPEDLFRPEVALRLGAVEIGRLLRRFGGNWAATVAAYNAGEAQAASWLALEGGSGEESWFLLAVAFDVTRGYVSDVLEASCVYSALYSGELGRGATAVTPVEGGVRLRCDDRGGDVGELRAPGS